ncbi:hypothetical protein [Pseudomonas sp. LRF_L74]|uniref:hypothetical protein n=1 Tax=Pseudomonas sp. LRF_L74 TaxID=3369422 RepID=UPI003F626CFE
MKKATACLSLIVILWAGQASACFPSLAGLLQETFGATAPALDEVVCKVWPARPELALLAVPMPRADFGDYGETDLQLLVVEVRSGKVVQRRLEYNLLDWDAIAVSEVAFDTAPYRLQGDDLAFGVRITRANHSRVNPFSESSLNLYLPQGKTLKPVLRALMVERRQGEWDDRCEGDWTTRALTVGVEARRNEDGLRQLLVKEVRTYSRDEPGKGGNCRTVAKRTDRERYRLTSSNGEYQVPEAIRTLQ